MGLAMNTQLERIEVRKRLAGKWQVPLFVVSAALLGGALYRLTPTVPEVTLEDRIEKMDSFVEGGLYVPALAAGRTILASLDGEVADERERLKSQAPIHRLMARARAFQAKSDGRRDGRIGRTVLDEMKLARDGRVALDASDHVLQAEASEWLGQYRRALRHYESAELLDPELDIEVRRRVLEIMRGPLDMSPEEIEPRLATFLADASERLDLLEWGLGFKVELLAEQGRTDELEALLDEYRARFDGSDLADDFEYLEALTLVYQYRYDEAEVKLRSLRNRLVEHDELFAKSGWLLGNVVLSDGGPQRPQEAIAFFRDVRSTYLGGPYIAASHLGLAEALVQLHRFDDALEHYDQAIVALPHLPDYSIINASRLRASLDAAVELLLGADRLVTALSFAERVPLLVNPSNLELQSIAWWRVGDLQEAVAEQKADQARRVEAADGDAVEVALLQEDARDGFSDAGATYRQVAKLSTLNETRSANATWRAAEMFDRSGDRDRVIVLLGTFLREHPTLALVPRVMLRMGQTLQSVGRYPEAIEAYQGVQVRFSRTPAAAASMVPLARCYLARGSDEYDRAERTLRLILDDSELFTPRAPEFVDATFLLGDLLGRRGEFERAIALLDEALKRYPDDPRAPRARFQLADAFRLSGLALMNEQTQARFVGERENFQAEQVKRLQRAEEFFGELVAFYEELGEQNLDELDTMYLRHARLFQGDCLYHTLRYGDALEVYERAAWIYKNSPASLAAYVQIINCHLFLGQQAEARAALMRALYLVERIEESQFAAAPARFNTRDDWRSYFRWLEGTDLL